MEAALLEPEKYTDLFRRSIETGKLLRKLARTNLEKIGYTWEEFDILRRLSDTEKVSISDLAAGSGRQKSNIIPIINAFEEKGYLKRKRDSYDRRTVWLYLTEKGTKEKKQVQEFQKEYIIKLLSNIDDDTTDNMLAGFDVMKETLNRERA